MRSRLGCTWLVECVWECVWEGSSSAIADFGDSWLISGSAQDTRIDFAADWTLAAGESASLDVSIGAHSTATANTASLITSIGKAGD